MFLMIHRKAPGFRLDCRLDQRSLAVYTSFFDLVNSIEKFLFDAATRSCTKPFGLLIRLDSLPVALAP